MFGNSASGDGTLVTAGFDSTTTPELEQVGEKGANVALAVRGAKSGLSEAKHFVTLLGKTIGGGTSTVNGVTPATALEIQLWQ